MKKSLIALAVAGVFATPAMADVTISGAIHMGIINGKSSGGSDPANNISSNSLFSSYSLFNLSSVDDIGGGNRVMFNYQFNAEGNQLATAGAALNNRNSYLGIGGDWGAVKWGVNENVYERMMYSSDFLDGAMGVGGNLLILGNPGVASAFDVGQAGCAPGGPAPGASCVGFYRRTSHTVWYESPNFSGLSFEVDYLLSAYKTATFDPTGISAGVKYAPDGMPFTVDVAYEQHDDFGGVDQIAGFHGVGTGSSTSTKDTGQQVGGTFTFGDFTVGARYERLEYTGNSAAATDLTKWKRDAYFINGKMNLPTGYAAVQYGKANRAKCTANGFACDASGTDARMIGIGYFHTLSAQSLVSIIYNQVDNKENAQYVAIGGTNFAPGTDHKGLFLGIKHTF
ncbi:MAG TPA: porin [Burkholderiales bacterium]|nr:porin [Burkholderiales bacterium]